MSNRVVITSAGVISSLGNNLASFWEKVCNGENGIAPIERFDVSNLKSRRAALIYDLRPKEILPYDIIRRVDRFNHMGLMAGVQCVQNAHLSEDECLHTGLIVNTTLGPVETNYRFIMSIETLGAHDASPALFPMTIMNAMPGYLAKLQNLCGYNSMLIGASAVEAAFRVIRLGKSERIVAGAVEEFTQTTFLVASELDLLASDEGFGEICHPFSVARNGFILGEGAIMLLLESLTSARKRHETPMAEIIAAATVADHTINPLTGFRSVDAEAMHTVDQLALDQAGLKSQDIDAIVVAASSARIEDAVEAAVILERWGDQIPVIAPKAYLGEDMGLDSTAAILIAALSLRDDLLPPVCYDDDLCMPIRLVRGKPLYGNIRHVLVHAWEHGGNTSTFILRKFMEEQ